MNKRESKQKVVLIRHGETEWALSGKHTSFMTWNAKINPGEYHSDKVKAKPLGSDSKDENPGH